MSEAARPKDGSLATPLSIFGLFIALAETVTGIGVTQTTGIVQLILALFVSLFPAAVLGVFVVVLWKRPRHFYPPSAYEGATPAAFYAMFQQQQRALAVTHSVELGGTVHMAGSLETTVIRAGATGEQVSGTEAPEAGNTPGVEPQPSTHELETALAASRTQLLFESLLRSVFGSQLRFLAYLRSRGAVGAVLSDAQPFYETHVAQVMLAEGTAAFSREQWLAFLLHQGLVRHAEDGRVYITELGACFLDYIALIPFAWQRGF